MTSKLSPTIDPTEFQERVKMLEHLDFEGYRATEYRGESPNRKEHQLNIFRAVELNLEPIEWYMMCRRTEDNYVGGCCGLLGAVQDMVNGWFRDGEAIDCDDLAEMAEAWISHGDVEWTRIDDTEKLWEVVRSTKTGSIDAWEKFRLAWLIVAGYCEPGRMPLGTRKDKSPLDASLSAISRTGLYLSFSRLGHRSPEAMEKGQVDGNWSLHLSRMYPHLKTLWEEVQKDPFYFEGAAIYDIKNEAVAQDGGGYSLFFTEEAAQERLDLWRRCEGEYVERSPRSVRIDERFVVRPVRVTSAEGLVFLDDGVDYAEMRRKLYEESQAESKEGEGAEGSK
jgi:hypothetical protein